jgi:hypothetical protein
MTMTLTLKLTKEEAQLREKAKRAGLDPEGYLKSLISAPDSNTPTLADTLKDYIGVVNGTPGPGDGRAWSEIEAACDPL